MRREGKILLVLYTFSRFRVSRMARRNLSLSPRKHNLNTSSNTTNNTNPTRVPPLPSALTVLKSMAALRAVLNIPSSRTHQNNNKLRLARTMLTRPARLKHSLTTTDSL